MPKAYPPGTVRLRTMRGALPTPGQLYRTNGPSGALVQVVAVYPLPAPAVSQHRPPAHAMAVVVQSAGAHHGGAITPSSLPRFTTLYAGAPHCAAHKLYGWWCTRGSAYYAVQAYVV